MKKVTYKGELWTVEKIRYRNEEKMYLLSGMTEYVKASDCEHWLSAYFNKFFKFFG